ncbi:TPA: hypothetical protein ACXP16_004766 [Klebsiella variicola subsp. variicola]
MSYAGFWRKRSNKDPSGSLRFTGQAV